MKTTTKKATLEKAIALLQAIDRRRALEKEEAELKAFFKDLAESEGENAILAGNILITISEKERANLDRKALEKDIGSLEKYEKVTKYKQVDVKAA